LSGVLKRETSPSSETMMAADTGPTPLIDRVGEFSFSIIPDI
jgi:hypothetical protein